MALTSQKKRNVYKNTLFRGISWWAFFFFFFLQPDYYFRHIQRSSFRGEIVQKVGAE